MHFTKCGAKRAFKTHTHTPTCFFMSVTSTEGSSHSSYGIPKSTWTPLCTRFFRVVMVWLEPCRHTNELNVSLTHKLKQYGPRDQLFNAQLLKKLLDYLSISQAARPLCMNIILQDALAYVVYSLSQPSFPAFKHTGLTTGLTVRQVTACSTAQTCHKEIP